MDVAQLYHLWVSIPNALGVDPVLQEQVSSAHFWLRQAFHALGGLGLALPVRSRPRAHRVLAGLLAAGMSAHEVHDVAGGQSALKAVVDVLAWSGGFWAVGSSRVDLQACKLEYSIVSPK